MKKKTDIIQLGILGVLVVIAFLLGSLLEKKNNTTVPTGTQQVADTQEDVVPSETNEEIAARLGLKAEDFSSCVASADITTKVDNQIASGGKSGVTGTPGSFLIDTQTGLAIELGGAVPLTTLKTEFASLKSGTGTKIVIDPISSEDFVKGNTSARYTLMVWSDFDCPYCKTFHTTAESFIAENTDVKLVYRQFPLDFHPTAMGKAIASLCAGKIGGNDMFWAFADELMKQE